jgi:glycosyltransferase involved in cell wall biosynthesis
MVPHAAMPAHLAACDILVSPHGRQADGKEFFGSPTKLYEYMASGRAIVASAIGQIADVLVDESSALLVPPDDAPALVSAITRLIDAPDLRARLAAAARAAAVAEHTWQQNAARVIAALEARRP